MANSWCEINKFTLHIRVGVRKLISPLVQKILQFRKLLAKSNTEMRKVGCIYYEPIYISKEQVSYSAVEALLAINVKHLEGWG